MLPRHDSENLRILGMPELFAGAAAICSMGQFIMMLGDGGVAPLMRVSALGFVVGATVCLMRLTKGYRD